MKHLLIIPLALLVLALPALAEEGASTMGTTNAVPPVAQPKPPVPQGMTAPKPGTERAELLKENAAQRKDLFLENQAPRKDFRQNLASSTEGGIINRKPLQAGMAGSTTRPMMGSTTRDMLLGRKELFLQNQEERAALLSENVAERRELFASSTAAKITEMRDTMAERKEHFASSTALRKAEFTEEMKTRILAQAEHAAELLDAMLARLTGIADRIALRIGELSDAGVDVSLAETKLDEAYDAIEAAGGAIEAAQTKIDEALQSETPGEMLPAAKTAGEEAKAALRTAHEALKEAAMALPKLPEPEEPTI